MSDHNGSVDSFDDFFGATKTDKDDDVKESKENEIPTSAGIAALIKTQPVVHHRQTPSETQFNINSKKTPLTTNVKNAPETQPSKSKRNQSPQSKAYESDFADDTSTDDKKKHSSLPPPKQRPLEPRPRRGSDSKLKASYTISNNNSTKRKEKFLPYIRPKNRQKTLPKPRPKPAKSGVEQRVLSAQNEQLNQLESKLAEVRRQLEKEREENRALRTIQKREEKALKKYEDQEYDVHKLARDYTHEIENVREEIIHERDDKFKLEQDIEEKNEKLRQQTKRMKFYEKLVEEDIIEETDELREKLKEKDKKIKKIQDKITTQDKFIENLENKYRHEIKQELIKQRDIKREIEDHSKKYDELLHRFENKTRQVDTMHIYIQHGGQRPSISSSTLSKSRSLQSLQDTSPRFREKILEYDKRRREEDKLKPKAKLKPLPLPTNPPPKRERKKYVPLIIEKPKAKKPLVVPPPVVHEEKPPIIRTEHIPPKGIPPVRRLSTPISISEDKSELEDETSMLSTNQRSASPPPPSSKLIQRREQHLSQPPLHKRPITPDSPVELPRLNLFQTDENTTSSNIFKPIEPPSKPHVKHEINDKWSDIFDTDKKEETKKDDLISKLSSDESEDKQPTPTKTSQRPSMIMFEPSSITTNGHQKKTPTRITATNVYDFDQAVINLHEGKPVTAQPTTTTKTSVDTFDSLFSNNNDKSTKYTNNRDDTFLTTQDKSDPFESLFTESSTAANASTTIKPNLRQFPLQNDKLQRPKVVTNIPKSVPNRTVVEEIEEFVL